MMNSINMGMPIMEDANIIDVGTPINWILIGIIIGSIILGIIFGIILGKRAMKKRDI